MVRANLVLTSIISIGLLGCATQTLVPAPLSSALYTQEPIAIVPQDLAAPDSKEYSSLNLSIKWPIRSYQTAALPTSTNALSVEVRQGDKVLAQRLVSREATSSISSVSIPLKATSSLVVDVKAFREEKPDLSTATWVARGTATNVTLVRSKSKNLSVTLIPVTIPGITSLSPTTGPVGSTVSITGTNFEIVDGATPSVYFGVTDEKQPTMNMLASSVVPKSSTSLEAVVPSNAINGKVVVVVDGIPSSSYGDFIVDNRLQAKIVEMAFKGILNWRRLVVTAQVTNPSPTQQQNGTLIVSFVRSGLLAETKNVAVQVSPGQTSTYSIESSVNADDALVSVSQTTGAVDITIE